MFTDESRLRELRQRGLAPHAFHMGMYEKRLTCLSVSVAPAGVELLNLWNDFRKVVKFIDENPWVKPMLARIQSYKNRGG